MALTLYELLVHICGESTHRTDKTAEEMRYTFTDIVRKNSTEADALGSARGKKASPSNNPSAPALPRNACYIHLDNIRTCLNTHSTQANPPKSVAPAVSETAVVKYSFLQVKFPTPPLPDAPGSFCLV